MGIVDVLHIVTILTCRLQHYQNTLQFYSFKAVYSLGESWFYSHFPHSAWPTPLYTCSEFFSKNQIKAMVSAYSD